MIAHSDHASISLLPSCMHSPLFPLSWHTWLGSSLACHSQLSQGWHFCPTGSPAPVVLALIQCLTNPWRPRQGCTAMESVHASALHTGTGNSIGGISPSAQYQCNAPWSSPRGVRESILEAFTGEVLLALGNKQSSLFVCIMSSFLMFSTHSQVLTRFSTSLPRIHK